MYAADLPVPVCHARNESATAGHLDMWRPGTNGMDVEPTWMSRWGWGTSNVDGSHIAGALRFTRKSGSSRNASRRVAAATASCARDSHNGRRNTVGSALGAQVGSSDPAPLGQAHLVRAPLGRQDRNDAERLDGAPSRYPSGRRPGEAGGRACLPVDRIASAASSNHAARGAPRTSPSARPGAPGDPNGCNCQIATKMARREARPL